MSQRQRSIAALLLYVMSVLLAACGEAPAPPSCYIYNFALEPMTSDGDPISIIAGTWIDGVGIQTVGNEIVANWQEPFYFLPAGVFISVLRPDGVTGEIEIAALADAFGRNVNDAFTLPSDVDEGTGRVEWDYPLPGSPMLEGNTFNGVIQTNQPLIVTSITIVLRDGEVSPYPVNSCDPPDITPEPDTPTPTFTLTETATFTGTPPTATPGCFDDLYTPSNTSPYWSDGAMGGTAPAPRYYRFDPNTAPPGVTLSTFFTPPVTGDVTNITVTWARSFTAPHSSMTIQVYALPSNTLIVTRTGAQMTHTYTVTSTTSSPLDPALSITGLRFDYIGFDINNGRFGPYNVRWQGCPPGSTPTPSPTPTTTSTAPTSTRTPLPSATGTVPTPTNPGVQTSTPMPSNTPLTPPPASNTPPPPPTAPPTGTPPPTVTPPPTWTLIPVPSPGHETITPWATFPGPALTPLPGTPIFDGPVTPVVGTLIGTPEMAGTPLPVPDNLREHHPGAREYLETAVGYVNELPRDLVGISPVIDGTFPVFAGYVKWTFSSVSLQEIFGQRIYPIPQHLFYGVTVVITIAIITMIFKITMFFVKLALWIVRFILKIIPFIG